MTRLSYPNIRTEIEKNKRNEKRANMHLILKREKIKKKETLTNDKQSMNPRHTPHQEKKDDVTSFFFSRTTHQSYVMKKMGLFVFSYY